MTRNTDQPQGFRSSLGAHAPAMREADPTLGREACRQAWLNHGLAVFNPKHFGWLTESRITQLANELYGKRNHEGDGK